MRLYQYWDTGDPPAEVAAWIEGFRSLNPELRHRLFDRGSAAGFIRKHFGPRQERAFAACAVPSMQADYFRLLALHAKGGLYADADFQCLEPLGGLLRQAPRSLLLTWGERLTMGLMLFRQPHDAFLGACVELATRNIEARRWEHALAATGPMVINAVRALVDPVWGACDLGLPDWPAYLEVARAEIVVDTAVAEAVSAITLIHTLAVERWIGTDEPAYKHTGRHWLNWQGPIYAEPAPVPA